MFLSSCRTAIFAILVMSLSGCGFQLQRNYFIPPELTTLHLTSQDEYSELTRVVQERLRLSAINLVPAQTDIARLQLLRDSLERTTLSVYPTGNVAEYELIYKVYFAVYLPEQEPQTFDVAIRRDYLDDPRTALAKTREMSLLTHEMRKQAADRILQTLSSMDMNNVSAGVAN